MTPNNKNCVLNLKHKRMRPNPPSRQLSDLNNQRDSLLAREKSLNEELKVKTQSQEDSINTRFQEIATLTNLLESKEKEYQNALISKEKDYQNKLEANMRECNGQLVQVRARLSNLYKGKSARFYSRKEIKNHVQVINESGLFDTQWYLSQYPDIATNLHWAKNPVLHYLQLGGFEGRNPSEKFDTKWYLEQNEDVAREGFNPLIHFILHGQSEGRSAKPLSDEA